MHYSQDLQVLNLTKSTLKLDPTALFTHLKIILLQCFQFSILAINGIQTDFECLRYGEIKRNLVIQTLVAKAVISLSEKPP